MSTAAVVTGPTPPLGRVIDYGVVDTDNSNNTIPWQLETTVVAVSPDGSSSESYVGNGGSLTVNGTRYGTVDQVENYDMTHALTTYTVAGSPPVVCTFTVPLPALPIHAAIGQAWPDFTSAVQCSNGGSFTIYRTNGSVLDAESLTLPVGVFSTTKSQYTRVLTYPTSSTSTTVKTEVHTQWNDTVTGRLLQATIDVSYANQSSTNGYLVHEVQQVLAAP